MVAYFGALVNHGVSLHVLEYGREARLDLITQSLEKYYKQFGHYPDELEELAEKKYLKPIPLDPKDEQPFNYETIEENGEITSYQIKIIKQIGQKEKIFKAKQ